MDAIISAFGIDWRLIAIQLFNFALLLGGLWYFLYTPVLGMLEKRRSMIEKGVNDAEAAAGALARAEEERSVVIRAAHDEASAVALRAKAHADQKSVELLKEAHDKSEKVIAEANRECALIQERLYKESEGEIAKTALLAAEKILKERAKV